MPWPCQEVAAGDNYYNLLNRTSTHALTYLIRECNSGGFLSVFCKFLNAGKNTGWFATILLCSSFWRRDEEVATQSSWTSTIGWGRSSGSQCGSTMGEMRSLPTCLTHPSSASTASTWMETHKFGKWRTQLQRGCHLPRKTCALPCPSVKPRDKERTGQLTSRWMFQNLGILLLANTLQCFKVSRYHYSWILQVAEATRCILGDGRYSMRPINHSILTT